MRIILDADILVYEAASHAEKTIRWQDGTYTTVANFDDAKARFKDLVKMWTQGASKAAGVMASEYDHSFAFSNPDRSLSYRKHLPHISYKAERAGMKRPVVCVDLEAWAIEEYAGVFEPALEGDDICGLWATQGEASIIITHDKDLMQIPGRVFKPRDQSLHTVTEESGERFFFDQVLQGDRVDGYGGAPGIGKVKANAALAGLATSAQMWESVVRVYEGVKEDKRWWPAEVSPAEAALATARVARILRGDEYDFDTQEVTLWTP